MQGPPIVPSTPVILADFTRNLEIHKECRIRSTQSRIGGKRAFGGETGYLKYRIGNFKARSQTFSYQLQLTGVFLILETPFVFLYFSKSESV